MRIIAKYAYKHTQKLFRWSFQYTKRNNNNKKKKYIYYVLQLDK